MRNNLKRILSLMLVVLCVTSFSVTAFASGGDEVATTPDTETTVTDESEAPAEDTAEDVEIPYSYTIDNDGNLVITVGGVADPCGSYHHRNGYDQRWAFEPAYRCRNGL